MINQWTTKSSAVFAKAILSVAFLASLTFVAEARWKCDDTCQRGFQACLDWCNSHNKTDASILKCGAQCNKYWGSGKNPQSIGRPDQTNPPRKVDPGKLKNPPTTVTNPNAPTQPPAQIREKRK